MKKILLLGSGELGKEFVLAAKRKGVYVIACDKYNDAPAMQVADEREVFSMLDGDALAAVVNKHKPDIIVPEIEAIRTERLFEFEKQGIQVVPSARAVNYTMNRQAIRDLAAKELGLSGFPCVIKPLMSSSGHGQSTVKKFEDLKPAFDAAMAGARGDVKEVIIEEFIHFTSEFTLLTVTQKNGPTLFCPPIGHVQEGGDYRESWLSSSSQTQALSSANSLHVHTIQAWLLSDTPLTSQSSSFTSVRFSDFLSTTSDLSTQVVLPLSLPTRNTQRLLSITSLMP